MSNLNEDVILERLIENVDKDLIKTHPIETVLMLDYCYKKGEQMPKDHFSGLVSKVLNKQINTSTKTINLDESNLLDCLFIESFEQLLPNNLKHLLPLARTAKDYKALIAITSLSNRLNNTRSSNSLDLDSKLFNLAKAYSESNLEQEIRKKYNRAIELSIRINDELKKPLNKEAIKNLCNHKKELNKNIESCSKYNDTVAARTLDLLRDANRSIDNKFKVEAEKIDEEYNQVKSVFENGAWNNEKRINKLVCLRPKLKETGERYQTILRDEGTRNCESLDRAIQETINRYEHTRDVKEEFKEIKRKISDYYKEIDVIFYDPINPSSIQSLNTIYLDLKQLVDKKFPGYITGDRQEEYYSNLEKILQCIKQKCTQRINYVVDQSAGYRQKIDKSFFSWGTKKFNEELKKYNQELEVWSKCQAI